MKYVILIHANPEPWGHPTSIYSAEGKALPQEQHDEMGRDFDALLTEISESGEFVMAEALADPSSATLYGWSPQGYLATDGPYAEAKEHLAGFYLVECDDIDQAIGYAARMPDAEYVAVEVRPVMDASGLEM